MPTRPHSLRLPSIVRLNSAERFRSTGMPLFVKRWRHHQDSPLHTHECSELVLILAGEAVHLNQDSQYRIHAGDVFVIHPDVCHGYSESDSLDIINIVFDRDHFATRLEELREFPGFRVLFDLEPLARQRSELRPTLSLSMSELGPIESTLTALQRELAQQRSGYRQIATAYFIQLLVMLSRSYESKPAASVQRLLRIARVVRQLEEQPQEPVTIRALAASCGLSESALIRAFSVAVGTTPIRLGASLLETTGRSVTEIAFTSGFSDSNYFARQFHRIMGATPRAYRNRQRKGDRQANFTLSTHA
jgi:AraC-like DNA-binding protein